MDDWISVILTSFYIFGLFGLAELLRRRYGFGSDFTRKVIHIGVGMLIWIVPFLFDEPWFFILAALSFAVLTFLDWRFTIIPAMASTSHSNLGTVYFPLAAAVVVYIFWDTPPLMVAALMPMTWGDGLAPIVGKLAGQHSYRIHNHSRTIEGSIAFFIASFVATWLALWVMPGMPEMSPTLALLPALVISVATTGVEAVSIWGLDNLTVTATSSAILLFWFN